LQRICVQPLTTTGCRRVERGRRLVAADPRRAHDRVA
jgi:hypothetical protein